MKNTRFAVAAAFAFLVMLTPVFGQSAGIRVEVPFNFVVGNSTLAAGEYKVSVTKPGMLQLQRTDGHGTASFMTSYTGGGANQDRQERLIFHNYGGHFFLSQVWIDDVNLGHEFYASAQELEYARSGHQTQTVLVAEGRTRK